MGKVELVMLAGVLVLGVIVLLQQLAYPVALEEYLAKHSDFTGIPDNANFDCQITFIHDNDEGNGIRIGIFNLTSGGMSRCGTLKQRCQIQEGVLEPKIGSYSLMEYSWACKWVEDENSCVCWS